MADKKIKIVVKLWDYWYEGNKAFIISEMADKLYLSEREVK